MQPRTVGNQMTAKEIREKIPGHKPPLNIVAEALVEIAAQLAESNERDQTQTVTLSPTKPCISFDVEEKHPSDSSSGLDLPSTWDMGAGTK